MPNHKPGELYLSWDDVHMYAANLARYLSEQKVGHDEVTVNIYPVPPDGMYAVLALMNMGHQRKQPQDLVVVESREDADIAVDVCIDTGNTQQAYHTLGLPLFALVDRRSNKDPTQWVQFPWDRARAGGAELNVVRLLEHIGEKPTREGLKETPARVVRSFTELYAGYSQQPADVMKVFEDGACDEMVLLRDAEFYSMCEHHMLPFMGRAHIAYLPDEKVLGVSKLARLLDVFARRLQIQERLTTQVTDALMEHLKPKGAACVIEAQHFCMVCRGVGKQNSKMVTSSLRGAFRNDPATRAEFYSMVRG